MDYLKDLTIRKLAERGVTITDIAQLTYDAQKNYHQNLDLQKCIETVDSVLGKREVINTVLTGIAIDEIVEKGLFDKEICAIIKEDKGLYGIDEILALGIVNIYGSIALTNFGYFDKIKPGIIGTVDKDKEKCNTFLDDIIGAVAAAAASKIAHNVE